MPRALQPSIEPRELLDSWGRRGNRLVADRTCPMCHVVFRPKESRNKYCSKGCTAASQRLDLAGMKRSFEAKLMPIPESGCLVWMGGINNKGYGLYRTRTKTNLPRTTHRLAWIFYRGPIPKGLHVCHKCDVRMCVNPHHLFLGTQKDNIIDMFRKGRGHRNGSRRGAK